MSAADIDKFLKGVEEPKRSTLEEVRKRILEIVPNAEQGIKYGMPAFMIEGKCFACIAPFKNHLNYSPYSGTVLNQLHDELKDFVVSKGSMQFAIDKPLSKALLKKLIKLRIDEIKFGKPGK
jgi:uncharacterized protein YdhG (YjbR/CyaY superfamily)